MIRLPHTSIVVLLTSVSAETRHAGRSLLDIIVGELGLEALSLKGLHELLSISALLRDP